MKNKKYNEYKVILNQEGEIVQKLKTKRGFVMITKVDAEEMNADFTKTKIFYEDATISAKAEKEATAITKAEAERVKSMEQEIEDLKKKLDKK